MIVVCPKCLTKNRVAKDQLLDQPQCAKCQEKLLSGQPIELTEQNFNQIVPHSDLPIFIDLWAEWCGPCKMMAPHFAEAARQNPHVIFAKIDTEANPRLSQAFHIRSIPTLVLMNKLTEVARVSGALRTNQIQQWLDQNVIEPKEE